MQSSKAKLLFGTFLLSVLLLVMLNGTTYAQCLKDNFVPGQVFKTTGNMLLDQKMNEEKLFLTMHFGVNPSMFTFDDHGVPNAFATPQNDPFCMLCGGSIFLGQALLVDELWSMDKGPLAVAGIMAHEYAHILQLKKGSNLQGKYRELHADFLAGHYMGSRTLFPSAVAVRAFANSLYQKGDFAFWDPSHHGTPEERVRAMVNGYNVAQDRWSLSKAYDVAEVWIEDEF